MREFKIGFTGADLTESVEWVLARNRGVKRIGIPFTGSCKIIAALASSDTVIESWDTQLISRAVIEGVFSATAYESAIDKPRYRKGHMYDRRPMKSMDDRCAGFVDFVGANGTLLDKAAIFSSVVRSSLMGRMTDWTQGVDINGLWLKFCKNRDYLSRFINLPGTFIHHEASVFEDKPVGPYELIHVDPPKVVQSSDIYSANYSHLNIALGGVCELPKWSWRDTTGHLRKIFEIDTERISFMYVSDVSPTVDTLRKVLTEYADIEEEVRLLHRSRYDYAMLAKKRGEADDR